VSANHIIVRYQFVNCDADVVFADTVLEVYISGLEMKTIVSVT